MNNTVILIVCNRDLVITILRQIFLKRCTTFLFSIVWISLLAKRIQRSIPLFRNVSLKRRITNDIVKIAPPPSVNGRVKFYVNKPTSDFIAYLDVYFRGKCVRLDTICSLLDISHSHL